VSIVSAVWVQAEEVANQALNLHDIEAILDIGALGTGADCSRHGTGKQGELLASTNVDPGGLAMKSKGIFVITVACALSAWVPTANAGGYLTPFRTGVVVTDYMINNNVGNGGTDIGLTILLSSTVSNPDSCGSTAFLHIKGTAPGYKEMVAAVMSAVASGRKIGFHAKGCELLPFFGGSTTYPIISDLWVVN
jgi:hypothetical protein